MKSILYNAYLNSRTGLSNLIMSVELGVVIARLTDRVLILKDNRTPIANVVEYDGVLSNAHPSRVTDLMDLGVPWIDANQVDLASVAPHDICDKPAWECVFYYPAYLSTTSSDIRDFAGRRTTFVTVDEHLQGVPMLSFSGGPKAHTLSFYSYFFYLDHGSQLIAHDALSNMKPRAEIAALAQRVANDLGPFNAVHVRRGDFKKTKGVTVLKRTPREAIAALDHHFDRNDRLVILTDEAEDPFFDEIRATYRDTVFLDHHVLQDYRAEFLDLPTHDSIAMAYLSQLVAAESRDFIGSMTSTFTSLIQRFRGNRGKDEPFKFLWNELPAPGDKIERGFHAFSDCIRLDKGVMVPEGTGPYSWNRYNERLNPAWMREWPESFLDDAAMAERARNREVRLRDDKPDPSAPSTGASRENQFPVAFHGTHVLAESNDVGLASAIRGLFESMLSRTVSPALADLRFDLEGGRKELSVNGEVVARGADTGRLLRDFYREIICRFVDRHPDLVWLHAGSVASAGRALVFPGRWGRGKSALTVALCKRGWSYLSDDIAPVDVDMRVIPFPATPRVRKSSLNAEHGEHVNAMPKFAVKLEPDMVADGPQPLAMLVFPQYSHGARAELLPMSPAQAVGGLLENCISVANNQDTTIERLCAIVETLPTYVLRFGDAGEAADLLAEENKLAALTHPRRAARGKDDEVDMDGVETVADVEVEVTLSGGRQYSSVLPSTSPILHDLYVALASRHHMPSAENPAILIQLPIDGGRAACSFMPDALVSVITRPAVLIQPQYGVVAGIAAEEGFADGPPPFVLIDDFLTPGENEQLMDYALANEADFEPSTVTDNRADYRRSKVLYSIKDSKWNDIFMSRLKLHLGHINETLNYPGFRIGESEIQLTASNDGEYFKAHADAGNDGEPTAGREITYVYYLNRTPRPYAGGDLLLYRGQPGQTVYDNGLGVMTVTPRNNSMVVFSSTRWHEVEMVRCPTGAFADSRFTVNGWLRNAIT